MIAKECSRIFQQLTEAKNLEWNKATIEVKLNGPVLKNDLLQELASQVHDLTIKVRGMKIVHLGDGVVDEKSSV